MYAAELHYLASSRERGDCKTIAHALAETGQMRNETVKLLGASQMPAEPCDRLVEDQQGATLLTKILDATKVALERWDRGFGFHDHTSDLVWMLVEQLPQALDIVVSELQS